MAPDMLAWPDGQCCGALQRGPSWSEQLESKEMRNGSRGLSHGCCARSVLVRDVYLTGQDSSWASSGVDSGPQCRLAINEVKRQKHRDSASRGQLASIWGHASRCIVATESSHGFY